MLVRPLMLAVPEVAVGSIRLRMLKEEQPPGAQELNVEVAVGSI